MLLIMKIVYELLVIGHLLGMAAIVGSWLMVVRAPRVVPGMVHGALLQLVTGLAMVGLRESKAYVEDETLDHAKIGVKLLIALVVAVLAWVYRNRESSPKVARIAHVVGGLAVLNVVIAVLWG